MYQANEEARKQQVNQQATNQESKQPKWQVSTINQPKKQAMNQPNT